MFLAIALRNVKSVITVRKDLEAVVAVDTEAGVVEDVVGVVDAEEVIAEEVVNVNLVKENATPVEKRVTNQENVLTKTPLNTRKRKTISVISLTIKKVMKNKNKTQNKKI